MREILVELEGSVPSRAQSHWGWSWCPWDSTVLVAGWEWGCSWLED